MEANNSSFDFPPMEMLALERLYNNKAMCSCMER